jgi:hypothetical protein
VVWVHTGVACYFPTANQTARWPGECVPSAARPHSQTVGVQVQNLPDGRHMLTVTAIAASKMDPAPASPARPLGQPDPQHGSPLCRAIPGGLMAEMVMAFLDLQSLGRIMCTCRLLRHARLARASLSGVMFQLDGSPRPALVPSTRLGDRCRCRAVFPAPC